MACSSKNQIGSKHTEEVRRHLSQVSMGKSKPWLTNERNHFWKGGVYQNHKREKDRFMHTLAYKNWRRSVLERDGNQCTQCGSTDKLHAHHLQAYREYKDLALDINNGCTLCLQCHKKTDTYGRKTVMVTT
jgi:5-methylcytosine-specific restriction endonuclease McrA